MKNKILAVGLLFSGLACAQPDYVSLKNGINLIDINADGVKDIVFSAIYDNNTSHPSQTINVFIKNKHGGYNIVPYPEASGFTWADVSLSASTTKIYDYKLIRSQKKYFMVSAEKFVTAQNGSDVSDLTRVKISRYIMVEGGNDPGIPAFQWNQAGSYITKEKYNDVDDALKNIKMDDFK